MPLTLTITEPTDPRELTVTGKQVLPVPAGHGTSRWRYLATDQAGHRYHLDVRTDGGEAAADAHVGATVPRAWQEGEGA